MDVKITRERMVRDQLIPRGITDRAVLHAMGTVQRHRFVEAALHGKAYGDHPLPIGFGQTISQPYIVALMSELLKAEPGMRVLEIGTGSGYQAAVLSEMGMEVYSVECLRDLYFRTTNLLTRLGYMNIQLKLSDGTEGWLEKAPFDRIMVTAGGPSLPRPLIEQLADPGLMIIPVGVDRGEQILVEIRKENGRLIRRAHSGVAFVDLVGKHGWKQQL